MTAMDRDMALTRASWKHSQVIQGRLRNFAIEASTDHLTCGTAFRTPPDIPTSTRQTCPLHSQLAPCICSRQISSQDELMSLESFGSKTETPEKPAFCYSTSQCSNFPINGYKKRLQGPYMTSMAEFGAFLLLVQYLWRVTHNQVLDSQHRQSAA